MPQVCVTSAMMACTFGAAPSSLVVTPSAIVTATLQVGTIMNFTPMANIPSFGTCMSIANPTVAAATAAAMGVLTPMPCIPMTVSPWITGSTAVFTGGMPTLDNSCKAVCTWGGQISITFAGQTMVTDSA